MSTTVISGTAPSSVQLIFGKGKVFKAVLLGAPGSHKAEISETIAQTFRLARIPVRERIHLNVAKDSKFGQLAKVCIDKGVLIPDKIMMKFISKQIMDAEVEHSSWLISGFPVTRTQAEMFWERVKLHMAILPMFPEDVLVNNLLTRLSTSKGKGEVTHKQKLEEIQRILNNYNLISKPMIDFYKERKVLQTFYSNTLSGVWPKIKGAIEKHEAVLKEEDHKT